MLRDKQSAGASSAKSPVLDLQQLAICRDGTPRACCADATEQARKQAADDAVQGMQHALQQRKRASFASTALLRHEDNGSGSGSGSDVGVDVANNSSDDDSAVDDAEVRLHAVVCFSRPVASENTKTCTSLGGTWTAFQAIVRLLLRPRTCSVHGCWRCPARCCTLQTLLLVEGQQAFEQVVQVREYAIYLGMDPDRHPELLFLAKYAMDAELPAEWTAHLDANGVEYFHNTMTGVSQYEHPLDEPYMKLYNDLRAKKDAEAAGLYEIDVQRATIRASAVAVMAR
jgi:WW domain